MPTNLDKNIKNFLSISDLNIHDFNRILELAENFKNQQIELNPNKKILGTIYDKSSTRTRVSFQAAMTKLGGSTIDLNPARSQIGRGEPIKDTARVLSRYCDAIVIRTFNHSVIEEYARWSTIPVINALTDLEHPCQALADFFTIYEIFGGFKDLVLTFIGDGNNVANSLILGGSLLGVKIKIACPKGYEPDSTIIAKARNISNNYNSIEITDKPDIAALGANILYTDVWASMGEELNKEEKEKHFKGFTIDKSLMSKANKDVIVLHCLPAYRNKEITDEVIESKNSKIFEQAENRMHVQQALLYYLLTN